jgi:hypothetical protein
MMQRWPLNHPPWASTRNSSIWLLPPPPRRRPAATTHGVTASSRFSASAMPLLQAAQAGGVLPSPLSEIRAGYFRSCRSGTSSSMGTRGSNPSTSTSCRTTSSTSPRPRRSTGARSPARSIGFFHLFLFFVPLFPSQAHSITSLIWFVNSLIQLAQVQRLI